MSRLGGGRFEGAGSAQGTVDGVVEEPHGAPGVVLESPGAGAPPRVVTSERGELDEDGLIEPSGEVAQGAGPRPQFGRVVLHRA
jgi:hypothetical protein